MKKVLCILLTVLMLLPMLTACGGSDKPTLNILNWGDFIAPELLDQFTEETGIEVNYSTMTSNEEMLVKLSASDCIYDLCFPSEYIVEKLIAQDMLYEINKDNIPNLKNIDEKFLDMSFDPGNTYSVPYMWCTVGILYNTKMVQEPVTSWDILWDDTYAGKILMYDSVRDTIGITLRKLGHSLNTRDENAILEAQEELIAQKPIVRAYLTDDAKTEMINGNAAMTVIYSGDAMYCMMENPDLAFAVPEEGSNYSFDNAIIPKTSANKENAEKFIDFLCRADVAKVNTEYIGYSTPNKAALELMDAEWIEDETYNPPQEVLDRCEIFHDLGDFIEVYNEAWLKIKGAN
ncbi:MAG: spermidine/putrescine ABC transporter substrate-binding protein [Clostridia bacterium]|nr:spermidine/putrescine ABC transporter substrate-binding protein [Clostridia bacterium]